MKAPYSQQFYIFLNTPATQSGRQAGVDSTRSAWTRATPHHRCFPTTKMMAWRPATSDDESWTRFIRICSMYLPCRCRKD